MTQALRTPEEYFKDLPDFPYSPIYIGMRDPVLGPPVMKALDKILANCPQPFEIAEAGHFVQEWAGDVAKKALEAFRL